MTALQYPSYRRGFLAVMYLLSIVFTSAVAQRPRLVSHEKMNMQGLHFWYNDANRPVALFNRNITPKGDCIAIVNDFIFFTWYKGGMSNRNLMLSRKKIGTNKWVTIQFPNKNKLYTRTYRGINYYKSPGGNSYRIAAVGISEKDATVHLVYNNHCDQINYRISKKNIAFAPDKDFKLSNFLTEQNYLKPSEVIHKFTYPNFTTNNKGELFLDYRVGGSKHGDFMMAYYNGSVWSSSYKIIDGTTSNVPFNFFGALKYQNAKLYLGGSIRIHNDPIPLNQGFYLGYMSGKEPLAWNTIDNFTNTIPFDSMTSFKIADPIPPKSLGMTGTPGFAVSKNGAIHFDGIIPKQGRVYVYKPAGASNFRKVINGSKVSFAAGNRIYGLEQVNGAIRLRSTHENECNWRTDLTYVAREKFDLLVYEYYKGKLYIVANENKESDFRPLHHMVIDLGVSDNVLKKSVFSNIPVSNVIKEDALSAEEDISVSGLNSKILLYPIPVATELFIERPNALPALIQIFGLDGKKIRSIATDQKKLKINTNEYPSGLYLITIASGDSKESFRFQKE